MPVWNCPRNVGNFKFGQEQPYGGLAESGRSTVLFTQNGKMWGSPSTPGRRAKQSADSIDRDHVIF